MPAMPEVPAPVSCADWRFRMGREFATAHPATAALRVNNGLLMRDAAVAGLGGRRLAGFELEQKRRAAGNIGGGGARGAA
jgi:hypothetical protein